ncbi:HNH endonuclease [Subdoligranulum variabile]|uniref:HNH endonuclease n=1 Tax=Subdoligranulum variabile TaxID=214851 RepID=UPI001F6104B3|nr:HNH endonuclease [Subdoligranulum variabile]UWP69737.1 HNH endonuclease [Subdoligranulum variabile]
MGGLCEQCLKTGLVKPGEIVHHKVHLTPDNINDPEVSLSWNNLELLCRDCHAKAHGSLKRYKVDEMGRVIIK